jgi:chemotaxis protein MotA
MKLSSLFGIVLGLVAIFGAYFAEGGSIDILFLWPAMSIVFGGSLAAGLAGSSFAQIAALPKLFYIAFFPPVHDKKKIIDEIVKYAFMARKEGILSIENKLSQMSYPFMRKLFKICIDGANPEDFTAIVESEVVFLSKRHNANIEIFTKLGGYAPTMGIIGTVMGLISALASAGSDPNVLIRHIASAFIATMWGILSANIIWLPIADKLKRIHRDELEIIQIMTDGIRAVQLGENPSVIRSKLLSAFPLPIQEALSSNYKEKKTLAQTTTILQEPNSK